MNKVSKIGLIIELISGIIMIVLVLLSQQIPDFVAYVFGGGLVLTLAGAIVNIRENKGSLLWKFNKNVK